jgi:hypothetical protein
MPIYKTSGILMGELRLFEAQREKGNADIK